MISYKLQVILLQETLKKKTLNLNLLFLVIK